MKKKTIIELRVDQVNMEFTDKATVCMIICTNYNAFDLRYVIERMLSIGCISFILCCDDSTIEDYVDYCIDDNEHIWKKFADLFGFEIVLTSIFSIKNISDSVDFFIYGFSFIEDIRMIVIYDNDNSRTNIDLFFKSSNIVLNYDIKRII